MLALLFTLLVFPVPAETLTHWDARITAVEGEVVVFAKGTDSGIPAEVDMPLAIGDRIETSANGRAELALEADSIFDLGAKTEFEIESLGVESSSFALSFGSVIAKIKSLIARRGYLRIRTPTAVAAVRGTEFGVEIDEQGHTYVGVFDEGKVGVHSHHKDSGAETVLEAWDEVRVEKGRRQGKVGRLKRFKRHHKRLKHLRARRAHLKRNWKRMGPKARAKMRREWRHRHAQHLKKLSPAKRKKFKKHLNRKLRKKLRSRPRRKIRKKILKNKKKSINRKLRRRGSPRGRRRR